MSYSTKSVAASLAGVAASDISDAQVDSVDKYIEQVTGRNFGPVGVGAGENQFVSSFVDYPFDSEDTIFDNGQVREMNATEKAAKRAAEDEEKKDVNKVSKLEKAAFLVLLDYHNDLINNPSPTTKSPVQFRSDVIAKYNGLQG